MAELHGVLLYDKPSGPTSHDVVMEARRRFRTRRVGHAGTLDPMASGLLVLLFGEATKLSGVLTAAEKEYRATVVFGTATSSFDAWGSVTTTREIPAGLLASEALERTLDAERARTLQIPPQVSAIKVAGRTGHERARAGEEFELDPRDVRVHELRLLEAGTDSVELSLVVSKGYYVRALARDLGAALGAPAHLSALRRLRSGPFAVTEAQARLEDCKLVSVASAVQRSLPHVEVNEVELERLRAGKLLGVDPSRSLALRDAPVVAALHQGELAALLEPLPLAAALHKLAWDEEEAQGSGFSSWYKVKRGFH